MFRIKRELSYDGLLTIVGLAAVLIIDHYRIGELSKTQDKQDVILQAHQKKLEVHTVKIGVLNSKVGIPETAE